MFKPVNRHILIQLRDETGDDGPQILLPDDYKPTKEKYTTATVLSCSDDLKFDLSIDSKIVIDSSMIEEIVISNTTYNIILENYVVGIVDNR